MRTTINLQDEALELCKEQARQRGVSLGEVISEAVLAAYRHKPPANEPGGYDLPVSGTGGVQPGVDLERSAELEDLMDAAE